MGKFLVILSLGAYLVLQDVESFPQKRFTIGEAAETSDAPSTTQSAVDANATTIDTNDSKYDKPTAQPTKYIEHSSEPQSSEETFYLPDQYDAPTYRLQLSNFRLLNEHTNKVIGEGHGFLQVSPKAINALPVKSVGIEANITRMTDILKRIDKLDLTKNNVAIEEKAEIIEQLSDLYSDFANMLHNRVPESDAVVLKELFDKIDLHGYNERIADSLAKVVTQIIKLVDKFFAKLNTEDEEKYAQLNEWYEDFKQPKADQEKFDDAVVLFNYLLLHRFR